ncbi:unnamed protein product [Arctia plantaginis]|uniref:Uncharacterized protein n=1 Tax=Arctia plantaginis TaxID=874455 RepID=A0A8S1AJ67_ARCPL|nr:unnamed protein product [Arctia plantaginis]
MFLSMWISNVLACGFMMPLVKAILAELEKMGILEIYQIIGKAQQISIRHEDRNQNEIALQMTEEEAQYIDTLLATQYHQLGQIKFHEFAVATVVMLTLVLQPIDSTVRIDHQGDAGYHDQIYVSSPCLMGVILLFIMPVNLDFLKFFKWGSESSDPLPRTQSKSCLNWALLNSEMNWSVPIILAGSSTLFESLRDSGMTDEFEAFFLHFANLPLTATIFVTVFFCKILTEFASSSVVVYGLLPSVAKMSIVCDINPHYMMLAVTLGSCLSFHLVTGAAVNAMVCSYAHIPPWRMMSAGLGPSVIAVVVVWFTVAIWSTAIWTDINLYPQWADINIFKMINKHT